MTDWLRFIGMIFYAPLRGMREVRDRGGLLPAFICAYLSQLLYLFAVQWLSGDRAFLTRPSVIFGNLFHAATALLPFAIVLVPLLALIANLFDRRGSFGLVLQQEYASLASVIFYVLIAANLMTILIATFFHFSGVQAAYVASSMQSAEQIKSLFNLPAEVRAQLDQELRNPAFIAGSLFRTVKITLFTVGALETVRKVFRLSILRSIACPRSDLRGGAGSVAGLDAAVYVGGRFAVPSADAVLSAARLFRQHRQHATRARSLQTESRSRNHQSARFVGALQPRLDSSEPRRV